jgi:hypothetical protein
MALIPAPRREARGRADRGHRTRPRCRPPGVVGRGLRGARSRRSFRPGPSGPGRPCRRGMVALEDRRIDRCAAARLCRLGIGRRRSARSGDGGAAQHRALHPRGPRRGGRLAAEGSATRGGGAGRRGTRAPARRGGHGRPVQRRPGPGQGAPRPGGGTRSALRGSEPDGDGDPHAGHRADPHGRRRRRRGAARRGDDQRHRRSAEPVLHRHRLLQRDRDLLGDRRRPSRGSVERGRSRLVRDAPAGVTVPWDVPGEPRGGREAPRRLVGSRGRSDASLHGADGLRSDGSRTGLL